MRLKRIKALTIKRSEWARGKRTETNRLLDGAGMRCCLGFWCSAAGVSDDDLLGQMDPEDVATVPLLVEGGYNSNLASHAIQINDDVDIADRTREAKLRELFATKGVKVRFVP